MHSIECQPGPAARETRAGLAWANTQYHLYSFLHLVFVNAVSYWASNGLSQTSETHRALDYVVNLSQRGNSVA